jgi:hypothetical protein
MKSISVGQLKPGQKLISPDIKPRKRMTERGDRSYSEWEIAGERCVFCGKEITIKDEYKHHYWGLEGGGHVHDRCAIKYTGFNWRGTDKS